MDIASSIQFVTEEIMFGIAGYVRKQTGLKNLCMAGGVALNCVGNGKIYKEKIFDSIWVQPASGDAGGALGAALAVHYHYLDKGRSTDNMNDNMNGSYLGPAFGREDIKEFLERNGYSYIELKEEELIEAVAKKLEKGEIIGWFQGRMEFGPRSLGARSIIADARNPEMQKKMNLKIKFRESFRPFAPSVLREQVSEWFEYAGESPYMLIVANVKEDKLIPMTDEQKRFFGINKLNVPRSVMPAITHVDNSTRIQTVDSRFAPRYHKLIKKFYEKTGFPVIINTSFNVRGEPIVCTPEDAYQCFMRTDMDVLILEDFLLEKTEQPQWKENKDWQKEFEPD